MSNQAVDPWAIAARWVPEVIGSSTDIMVVMDWTDFDADGQTTLALNKVTPHGRAGGTFLTWLNARNAEVADTEYVCRPQDAATILERVADVRPD